MRNLPRAVLILSLTLLILLAGCNETAENPPVPPEAPPSVEVSDASSMEQTSLDTAPKPAIDAILEAYKQRQVVAIGDIHGLEQERDFIASLVKTPAFYNTVKVIVIEIGNAIHQDLADAYVNGGNVTRDELRAVWRDMTSAAIGPTDKMSSEDLFDAVREINATLPENERLRIVLGDPPVDWSKINVRADLDEWLMQRDTHYYGVVKETIYDRDVNGLLICGAAHLTRNSAMSPLPKASLMDTIEKNHPASVFLVHVYSEAEPDARLDTIAVPSMLPASWIQNKTSSGNATFGGIPSGGGGGNTTFGGGSPQAVTVKTAPAVDGYLYLGPPASFTMIQPDPSLYLDDTYFEELNRRNIIFHGTPLDQESLTK